MTDNRPVLAEHHLKDLRSSGLSDETIAASRCYSALPEEIARILGFDIGSGGLVFLYPGPDNYRRVKADTPPLLRGKPAKYLTPKKAPNRLYAPAFLDRKRLKDVKETLLITEGEKKALKACQEGLCCVGLAGVWSWKTWAAYTENGARHICRHIKDLDALAWKGREVLICFDSDIRVKPQVQQAERDLARLIASWGAKVYGVRLPHGKDKCGLDDYLLTNIAEKIYGLPRVDYGAGQIITADDLLEIQYEETEHVIGRGILPVGGCLILAGESGAGKTLMALEWALRLAHGLDILGLEVPAKRRVFIQEAENPHSSMQFRLRRMMRGLGLDRPGPIIFGDTTMRFDLGTKRDQDKLKDYVAQASPEVIILDPLSSFIGEVDENANIKIRTRLDALTNINRELGSSLIVIDHYGKPSEGRSNAHRLRGASSKRDWCDTLIGLDAKPHESKVLRLVEFHKVRHGPQQPSIIVERSRDFIHEPVQEDSLVSPERIVDLLEEMGGRAESKKKLIDQLCERTGCSYGTARKAVGTALDMKLVRFGEEGQNRAIPVILYGESA